MRDAGIFYQTKRGKIVPKEYRANCLNTDLAEAGKLCLCAIFQLPGMSRSKPSSLYKPQYYDAIFNKTQPKIAGICRELLYIDDFFRTAFIRENDIFRDLDGVDFILPPQIFRRKDEYDNILRKLFGLIISYGITAVPR